MPGIDSRAPERTETSSGSSRVAQPLVRVLLEPLDGVRHLRVQPLGERLARVHVRDARLRRDREPGGDEVRVEDARHLGDVGALAAQQ